VHHAKRAQESRLERFLVMNEPAVTTTTMPLNSCTNVGYSLAAGWDCQNLFRIRAAPASVAHVWCADIRVVVLGRIGCHESQLDGIKV
jgi:hypothetical protein